MPHAECLGHSCVTPNRSSFAASRRLATRQFRHRWAFSHSKSSARKGSHQRRCCQAAAASDQATDLTQLFKDALETPKQLTNNLPNVPKPKLDTEQLPSPTAPTEGFLGQVGPTAGSVKEQAAPAAQAVKKQAGPAAQAVQDQAQTAPQAAAQALPDAASDSVTGSAQSAAQQLTDRLKSATDAIPNPTAAQDVREQITSVTDAIPSPDQAILKALDVDAQQASSAASSSLQAVQEGPGQLLEDFSQGLNHSLNQALPGLQESIDSTLAGFTSQANQAASSLIEALPAPASEALESAATALQSAATALQPTADELRQYISSDPKVGAAAAGVVFGIPLLANWKARFAGYSGQLQPDKAADMLNRRNVALIDIRSDAQRNTDGIPVLRRGSRGKGAAVPVPNLRARLASKLTKSQTVLSQMAALQIIGLRQVNRGTRLVIMDKKGGSDAISIARSIAKLSPRKVYVVAGGFRGWARAGLDIQDGTATYKATVLDTLSDEAEAAVEATNSFLRDPIIAIAAVGGVALGGLALLDWHYALEYVGTVGVLLTIVAWFTSYDSPQDAVSDVGATLQKAVAFVSNKSKSVSASVDPEIEGPDGFISSEQSSTSSGSDDRSEANDSGAASDSQRTKQASGPGRQQENKIAS